MESNPGFPTQISVLIADTLQKQIFCSLSTGQAMVGEIKMFQCHFWVPVSFQSLFFELFIVSGAYLKDSCFNLCFVQMCPPH